MGFLRATDQECVSDRFGLSEIVHHMLLIGPPADTALLDWWEAQDHPEGEGFAHHPLRPPQPMYMRPRRKNLRGRSHFCPVIVPECRPMTAGRVSDGVSG